jgi:hypothetical protein
MPKGPTGRDPSQDAAPPESPAGRYRAALAGAVARGALGPTILDRGQQATVQDWLESLIFLLFDPDP